MHYKEKDQPTYQYEPVAPPSTEHNVHSKDFINLNTQFFISCKLDLYKLRFGKVQCPDQEKSIPTYETATFFLYNLNTFLVKKNAYE